MTSPVSSTTVRTVPCIAGCAGPMLTIIGSAGSSISDSVSSSSRGSIGLFSVRVVRAVRENFGVRRVVVRRSVVRLPAEAHPFIGAERRHLVDVGDVPVLDQGLDLRRVVVLAQRMAEELGVEEN